MEKTKIEDEPKHAQAKQLSKSNRKFKLAELVGISEAYEYQHNATKNRIHVTRGDSKFAILFEQTTYMIRYVDITHVTQIYMFVFCYISEVIHIRFFTCTFLKYYNSVVLVPKIIANS